MENPLTHPSLPSKAFPEGGIYIMRSERIYLLAMCHQIGVNGVGPHKHNDWLSFELCVDGKSVIVDPGTYCYTGNMEMRRLFRSTAYHNTVVIDGKEQVSIHNSMFGLINPHGEIRVLRWESEDTHDLLETEHTGYTRLENPVTHSRRFLLDKTKNEVEITDTFIGNGEHTFEWYLHLDVRLDCKVGGNKVAILKNEVPCLKVTVSDFDTAPQIRHGWVSQAYNRREEAYVINWSCTRSISSFLPNTSQFCSLYELE